MLSKDQFYITEAIEKIRNEEPESYFRVLSLREGDHPYYDFVAYELENYPRLELMLALEEKRDEFITNAYFFIYIQSNFYRKNDVPGQSITELVFQDVKDIFAHYNTLEITPNFLLDSERD